MLHRRLRLLLLSAVVAYPLILYYGLHIQLFSTTMAPTSQDSDTREPHLDPARLINSPVMQQVNERVRVAVYNRLSSKLAGYYTTEQSAISHSRARSQQAAVSTPNTKYSQVIIKPKGISTNAKTRTSQDTRTTHPKKAVSVSRDQNDTVRHGTKRAVSEVAQLSNRSQFEASDTYHKTDKQNILSGSSPSPMHRVTPVAPFTIGHDYHWPQPRAVRPLSELMAEQWMTDLQACVRRMTSHEVILLTSNQPYTEVLLNWLIAAIAKASVELSQVLVIAMDQRLHSLLTGRGVPSVLVRPAALLTTTALKKGVFPSVMMTRLSVIRLLNHWGYDVFNFDTDAILLRDPTHLLRQKHSGNDIIGTFGRFPTDLTNKWGITLCTALLVVRSSAAIEEFWEVTSRVASSSYSDQGKMNYGLEAMDVQWTLPSRKLNSLLDSVEGVGRSGLRVSLLPYNVACRAGSCTRKAMSAGLYIWHKGGARAGASKRGGAQEGGVWFLRSDWTVGCDNSTAIDWLKCISVNHVFTF